MAFLLKRREIVSLMGASAALSASGGFAARAQDRSGKAVYPVATPTYEVQFVADTQGFFKDEGYAFKVIQGGSGVKTREILASRQADFAIADILHVLQLNNHSRPARALNAVDSRAPGVRFAIRKDLYDQGVNTIQKAADWKRPDGKRAIFGVSSIGGTSHLWSHYFADRLGIADKVTWIGVGNTDTMLGAFKTKQIDVLSASLALIADSEENGWGKQIYAPSELKTWNQVIGGAVPVNTNFCLLQTIEKEPEKVQAFTNAIWRATQWLHEHSVEETLGAIERYVGSTSPEANKLEITELKAVQDTSGLITPESYARGEKVWYSDLTGIKPVKLEDAFEGRFLKAAQAKYPA
jgi:NitT/TauT family transport system substrate-binding protein